MIADWRKRSRKKPDKFDLIVERAKKGGVNIHWLFTGEGPMYIDPKKESKAFAEDKELAATFHEGSPEVRDMACPRH